MWSRKKLKTKSKIRFRANYWKSVLVALILMFVVGGVGSIFTWGWEMSDTSEEQESGENLYYEDMEASIGEVNTVLLVTVVLLVVAVVVLVVVAIVIPLQILIFNPLEIGCKRFFIKNLKEDAPTREICYAFDNNYKNNIKTMFFRDLYIILWSLLLIIPGLIKAYEYQMIPYILAERPQINKAEAFALSKKMMYGNKWKSFVLDLSFLGWHILNIFTLGILGIFYVSPYEVQTEAALYDAIKNQ